MHVECRNHWPISIRDRSIITAIHLWHGLACGRDALRASGVAREYANKNARTRDRRLRGPADVRRRSRGSATLPRHTRKNAFQSCNVGRYRTLPTEGIEPTHCCQYWILSPARLPIPPRRLFARRQLLIPLRRNASAEVEKTGVQELQELQEFRSSGVQDAAGRATLRPSRSWCVSGFSGFSGFNGSRSLTPLIPVTCNDLTPPGRGDHCYLQ